MPIRKDKKFPKTSCLQGFREFLLLFDIDSDLFARNVCGSLHELTDRFCDLAVLADDLTHVGGSNGESERGAGFRFLDHGNHDFIGTVNNRSRNVGESTLEIVHTRHPELFGDAGFFEKALNSFSGLSAVLDPVLCFFRIDLDFSGVGEGVVVTDFFDESTIAGVTGVCNNYAVKGSFLSADSFESDFNGHFDFLQNKLI